MTWVLPSSSARKTFVITGALFAICVSIFGIAATLINPLGALLQEGFLAQLSFLEWLFIFIAGMSIYNLAIERRQIAIVSSFILLVFTSLLLINYWMIFHPSWQNNITEYLFGGGGAIYNRTNPNATFCLWLLSAAIITISNKYDSRKFLAIGSILGLCAITFTGLGVYCYYIFPSLRIGLLDLMAVSPVLALNLFLLGSCVVLAAWDAYDYQDAPIYDLLNTIEIIASSGIALLALCSAAVGILTWYSSNQVNLQERIIRKLGSQVLLVEEYFARIKDVGNQIANQPVPVSELADYQEGKLSRDVYVQRTSKNLEVALSAAPALLGITRVDINQTINVSAGITAPYRIRKSRVVRTGIHAITFPFLSKGGPALVVKTPIFKDGELLGADFLVVSVSQLDRILLVPELLGSTGRLFIGGRRADRLMMLELTAANKSAAFGSTDRKQYIEARVAMRKAVNNKNGILSSSRKQLPPTTLSFYSPIKAAEWGIVLTMQANEFWSRMGVKFRKAIVAVVLLTLLGTLFFSLFIRGFFRHVFRLEDLQKKSQLQLRDELTRREQAEEGKHKISIELAAIVENATNGILTLNAEGIILSINRAMTTIFGYEAKEVVGTNITKLFPSIEAVKSSGNSSILFCDPTPRQSGDRWEIQGRKKDGTDVSVEFSIKLIQIGDQLFCTAGVYDLTERNQISGKLEESLKEKEILLKEIHHRVKNNLQVISSIFSIQRRRIDDPQLVAVLEESQKRIQSIALLHETLYRSQNLAKIDMEHYLKQLLSYHLRSSPNTHAINGQVSAEGVYLNIDRAIPCGLIINELLTNSMKYAFPEGNGFVDNRINISFFRNGHASLILEAKDNGKGIPTDVINQESSDTLGLLLVKTLCQQLGATMAIDNSNGTTFRFVLDDKGANET